MEKSLILLQELGFNPKEIEVYLLLLESGTTQASTLARRLKLPTSTAQYACQQLTKKGLLRMVQKGNRYLFSAEPPSKLSVIVEKEIENLQRKQSSLDSVIAELESKVNPESVLPKVKFFEGREGLVDAYREVLRDIEIGGEVLSYLQPIDLEEDALRLAKLFEDANAEFVRKKVRTRILLPFSKDAAKRLKHENQSLEEHRFIPDESFECSPTEIMITGTKQYFMSVDESHVFATIMQNKNIANMQRKIFEMLWNEVVPEYWGQKPYPNATVVGVTWLAGFQFEIKVVARLPKD